MTLSNLVQAGHWSALRNTLGNAATYVAHFHAWVWAAHPPSHLIHDGAVAALAAAVAILGGVLLTELRSLRQLKQGLARDLSRVFEQLDLLRFDSQRLVPAWPEAHEAQADESDARVAMPALGGTPLATAVRTSARAPELEKVTGAGSLPYESAATLAARGLPADEIAARCGLAAGEARLLASLAQARASARAS